MARLLAASFQTATLQSAYVESCTESFPWFDLISWDVAIDAHDEPRIIEFNVANQELYFHQMTNNPVFGSEGSAVLSAVLRRLPARSRTRSEAQKGRPELPVRAGQNLR